MSRTSSCAREPRIATAITCREPGYTPMSASGLHVDLDRLRRRATSEKLPISAPLQDGSGSARCRGGEAHGRRLRRGLGEIEAAVGDVDAARGLEPERHAGGHVDRAGDDEAPLRAQGDAGEPRERGKSPSTRRSPASTARRTPGSPARRRVPGCRAPRAWWRARASKTIPHGDRRFIVADQLALDERGSIPARAVRQRRRRQNPQRLRTRSSRFPGPRSASRRSRRRR